MRASIAGWLMSSTSLATLIGSLATYAANSRGVVPAGSRMDFTKIEG
jgi:hypothetical protein